MSESVKLGANLTFEEREADPIGSGGLHFAGRSGKSHDMRVLVEACVIWIDIDDDHLCFPSDYTLEGRVIALTARPSPTKKFWKISVNFECLNGTTAILFLTPTAEDADNFC